MNCAVGEPYVRGVSDNYACVPAEDAEIGETHALDALHEKNRSRFGTRDQGLRAGLERARTCSPALKDCILGNGDGGRELAWGREVDNSTTLLPGADGQANR